MATAKKKPRAKSDKGKKTLSTTSHSTKATPTAKPQTDVNSFLKGLTAPKKSSPKKKDDKPTIVLPGKAAELLRLQQAKATLKTAEGVVKNVEGELFGSIEEQRLAICAQRKSYVGSIKVTATGEDEEGNSIDPGIASYYIQNKYRAFDFFAESDDDELQEEYDGEATLLHEAISAVMDAFNDEDDEQVSAEEAEQMIRDRFEVTNSLRFGPEVLEMNADGTPKHPEALALLQNPALAPFLQNVSTAKPTKTFHENSQWDETERAIMESLNRVGLSVRYKAVLKPSGAPKQ